MKKATFVFILFLAVHSSPAQIINTICGNGSQGFGGDNGPALNALLNDAGGVCADRFGNLYIYDYLNARIRKIDSNGIIKTIAGTGTFGHTGDGGPADSARIGYSASSVSQLACDAAGNLYFVEETAPVNFGHCLRRISTNGIITTIAGVNGPMSPYTGDMGGWADTTHLGAIKGVALDASGNIYIACSNRICKVNGAGYLTTIGGTGASGYSGDGGMADTAHITAVNITIDPTGNIYFCQEGAFEVRKISPNGIITRFAGTGINGYSGDNGPADSAQIDHSAALACNSTGDLFIGDNTNNVIRRVDHATHIITTWGGTGQPGTSGDGCLVSCAKLDGYHQAALAFGPGDRLYCCYEFRIREVTSGTCTCPTGITEATTLLQLTLYPDPAGDELGVSFGQMIQQGNCKILDLTGREIMSIKLEQQDGLRLNLEGLPAGVYVLSVQTAGGTMLKKFIKK